MDKEETQHIKEVEADLELDPSEKEEQIGAIRIKFEIARLPYRIVFDVLGDGNFYNPKFRGNQAHVIVNKEHPFFEIYERATQIPEQRILLDLLHEATGHKRNRFFRYQPYIELLRRD